MLATGGHADGRHSSGIGSCYFGTFDQTLKPLGYRVSTGCFECLYVEGYSKNCGSNCPEDLIKSGKYFGYFWALS